MEPTCGVHHWQSLTATTFIGAMPSSWYPLKWNVTYVHNQNPTGTGICVFPGLSYGDALVCSQLPTLKDRRNDICLSFSNQWKSLTTNYTILFQISELVDIHFVNLVNTNQRKQKLTELMVPWWTGAWNISAIQSNLIRGFIMEPLNP